jgi:O-antigen ligase
LVGTSCDVEQGRSMFLLTKPGGRAFALLVVATVLLPFQWWPPMPYGNMQLSDIIVLAAFIQFLFAKPKLPAVSSTLTLLVFTAGVSLSAYLHGGYIKLVGHMELVALCWMVCSTDTTGARELRRAIVVGSPIAAISAMAGVVLFYIGVQTELLNPYGGLLPGDYPRVRGLMFHANLLAPFLATGFLLLWYEPELLRKWGMRWMVLAIVAIALIFTFSRTIVALVIVFSGSELLRRRVTCGAYVLWGILAGGMLAGLFVSVVYDVRLDPLHWWEIQVINGDGIRWIIWQDALETIRISPLFGIGPGHPVANGWWAHNTWLNLWAGLGLLPLFTFAVLFLQSTIKALRLPLMGVTCALAVGLIDSFSVDIEDFRHVWLLMGLANVRNT